jgi:hypothetical protein
MIIWKAGNWQLLQQQFAGNPPCPLLMPSAQGTELIRHNTNLHSIFDADVSARGTTTSLHQRFSIDTYVSVSTTGDSLIVCQIFQQRRALEVHRDCLHSTFPQLLYITLMRHELLCSSCTKMSHAILTIPSEYIWMKIYGTPGGSRRSKITWLQPAAITFMQPSSALRLRWHWICMGR